MMSARNRQALSRIISEVVRRGASCLEAESRESILDFVSSQINSDGGFRGRSETSDLYYTYFGVECLDAFDESAKLHRTRPYLNLFVDTDSLDLVHRAALIRCLTKYANDRKNDKDVTALLSKIEAHRSPDGGYRLHRSDAHDSIYASFLALLAIHSTGREPDGKNTLIQSIRESRTDQGGYTDQAGASEGTTTVTAAAVILLHALDGARDESAVEWLLRRRKHGGFLANPKAPAPDLLSTATALLALKTAGFPMSDLAPEALEFVDTLWDAGGGFCGHILDTVPDCEYTYYGLLSLGSLAEGKEDT